MYRASVARFDLQYYYLRAITQKGFCILHYCPVTCWALLTFFFYNGSLAVTHSLYTPMVFVMCLWRFPSEVRLCSYSTSRRKFLALPSSLLTSGLVPFISFLVLPQKHTIYYLSRYLMRGWRPSKLTNLGALTRCSSWSILTRNYFLVLDICYTQTFWLTRLSTPHLHLYYSIVVGVSRLVINRY